MAYITARDDCRVEWFADSLARHVPVDERHCIHLVFVDRLLWALTPEQAASDFRRADEISLLDRKWHVEARREKFANAVRGRFDFIHIPVKPNNFQGPFRLTSRDMFCAAESRNTAIAAARHDYFVVADDLSVLLPTWWPQVKHAASSGYAVAGAYWKQKDLVVQDGEIKSFTEYKEGRDTRWDHGSESGIVRWHGGDVYGCSFGAPTEALLRVNGVDEICNGQGGEDYDLGIRMERAGVQWWYNRNMQTWESEEAHHTEPSLPRVRKIVTPDRLPAGYEQYPHARYDERHYSDHVLLNSIRHEQRHTTVAKWTNLRQLRNGFLADGRVPIPTEPVLDWRDGTKLEDL